MITCTEARGRVRKAWICGRLLGEGTGTYFAPTAGKARTQLISDIMDAWDVPFIEAAKGVRVSREPRRDVLLPPRWRLAAHMPEHLLHMVVHAYGGKSLNSGYRDYFYTATDDPDMLQLVHVWGMFCRPHHVRGGYGYFRLTDLGKRVAAGEQPLYPGE